MPISPSPYFSYLLRLWLAGDDDQSEWRLALIDPHTGEQHGFARLEALTAFLQARMEAHATPQAGARPTPHSSIERDDGELTD